MSPLKPAPHQHLSPDAATSLATALRERRNRAALTQEEVAAGALVSVQLVRRLERGTANPTLGTLEAVAAALGVRVSTLLKDAGI